MEHITGVLKIALLQSQFIFFFPYFSLSAILMLLFFSLFRTSLRKEMSNGEKACQLIYQPMCSSLCYQGWAAEAVGPRALWLDPFLSVTVLAIWLQSFGDRVKMNEQSVFMGSCRNHGHRLLVRPGVLNLWAKLATDTVLRERIYHEVRMDEARWRRKASGRCVNKER